jgi:hypothetical protein
MTNATDTDKRIKVALTCLPDAPYREMLRALFADMTAERGADKKYIRELEDAVTPEIVSLTERVKALEADAGRYRYLRKNSGVAKGRMHPMITVIETCPSFGDEKPIYNLDAAIDAAIKGATT